MRHIRQILIVISLSLILISCKDDDNPTENNETAAGPGVEVDDCRYELTTTGKNHYNNAGAQEPGSEFFYGMRVTVKLDDPSKRDKINRLIISAGNSGCDLNKEELQEAYSPLDSGYVIDIVDIPFSYTNFMSWTVTLYDAKNNPSPDYTFSAANGSRITSHSASISWAEENSIRISLSSSYSAVSFTGKVQTHFLNSDYEELHVSYNDINGNSWTASGAPAEAVYAYYEVIDDITVNNLSDSSYSVKRRFISQIQQLPGRLPDNVEYVSSVSSPSQVEYISGLDKILALSVETKELTLLNYDNHAIIWQKQLREEPIRFSYSQERNIIYLAYTNNEIDSINIADGSSGQLVITPSFYVGYIIAAKNFLLLFPKSFPYDFYASYNIDTKNIITGLMGYSFNFELNFGIYDIKSESIYLNYPWSHLHIYSIDAESGKISSRLLATLEEDISYKHRVTVLSPDGTKFYVGEGKAFYSESTQNGQAASAGTLEPFIDLAFVSDSYIAAITSPYSEDYYSVPSSIAIYDAGLKQLGKKSDLIGNVLRIFNKGENLRVYSSQYDGKSLIVQKFNVNEIIGGFMKKNTAYKKFYKLL